MSEKQIDKLLQLAEKLGGAGSHVWQDAVRLQTIQAWYLLALTAVLLTVVAVCAVSVKHNWSSRETYSEEIIAASVIGFVALLFAMMFGYDGLAGMLAPEGSLLLKLLKEAR